MSFREYAKGKDKVRAAHEAVGLEGIECPGRDSRSLAEFPGFFDSSIQSKSHFDLIYTNERKEPNGKKALSRPLRTWLRSSTSWQSRLMKNFLSQLKNNPLLVF